MNKQDIDFKTLIISIIGFIFGVWSLIHVIKRDFNFFVWLLPAIVLTLSIVLFIGSLEKEDEDEERKTNIQTQTS